MDHPYPWLQDLIDQVPDLVQPLIVAGAAAVPYVEGEGAAVLGILAGIDPVVAGLAAAAGNILCVVAVVLLGSRIRGGVGARRAARAGRTRETSSPAGPLGGSTVAPSAATALAEAPAVTAVDASAADPASGRSHRSKGHARLRRWMVRFGVPGASLLAPIALPTMLTAAFFVASGVRKEWVILWQVVAIVLWTGLVVVAATGLVAALGW
ncbi:small multidrug efflux protein [Cellulomonas sp. NS3]|uniref:small multidrug efflux protein n=1 Tax=Cellulomonas sp. NS3 TaxID=2973977 RepID=UPI002162FE22|nr:small multidrug efflux protein [Cellulomonas sp. NS3]